jgi:hypothetical protein
MSDVDDLSCYLFEHFLRYHCCSHHTYSNLRMYSYSFLFIYFRIYVYLQGNLYSYNIISSVDDLTYVRLRKFAGTTCQTRSISTTTLDAQSGDQCSAYTPSTVRCAPDPPDIDKSQATARVTCCFS